MSGVERKACSRQKGSEVHDVFKGVSGVRPGGDLVAKGLRSQGEGSMLHPALLCWMF